MINKILLGGTTNNDWRDKLIPELTIGYFNPIVDEWNEDVIAYENYQKTNACNIHLYVITASMTGTYTVAELIESVMNDEKTTILQVMPEGFDEEQLKSFKAVGLLVEKYKGIVIFSDEFVDLLLFIDNWIDNKC